ncbi:hypothetical protein HO173_006533 [Letharia columbiana]|uniref:J domain-containing protein n=1 Tax=Letharia columbiana TaxID=112416 RepID=A0A8H6L4J6_9LECA|nr:uncharacterized protein HO173_006533 [Letharia columbiana]KAF6235337.1 hypothetical protein HO173_006533 [Letharia columbiana]
MGRADAERDYYGDLELEPTADPNEIKRQFKKLALKYHPDRNPGREVEYNSKFQAIQSANEVLSDPQQRAKYDAQRMRAGLLHTYTGSSSSPTRPSVPTRSPMTDFPPPPRPPPYTATKNTSTPHSSGAQRYKDFRSRPEPASWRGASTDDPKTKTSDFKAWESMRMRTPRRGEGPIPFQRRTVPPKAARPPPVPPGRETNGKAPKDPSPRRPGWDHVQEPHAGMPSTTRADTSRGPPQKNGFAPSSPGVGGDEPQARSAYFTVGRGERPANLRSQTHMPPPPPPLPGHAPTSQRADPLAPFKDKVGLNEPFGNKSRISTPYHTGGGEKISPYFASPGLERSKTSASPRDSNSRTGWFEGKPNNSDSVHHRAASTSSNHQNMSPPDKKDTRMPGVSGVYSSSSSSSSSSDEDVDPVSSARPRVTQIPKTRRTRADAGQTSVQPPGGFNPFVKVGDEPMAPQAGLGAGNYEIRRRHSAVDIDTRKPSEGFSEHRKKHEADRSQQHSTSVPDASDPHNGAGTQPTLQRSHSWHEKNGPPKDKDFHSAANEQEGKNPIFKIPEYAKNSFPRTASLRSQNSEQINTKFSPDNWHGKFFEPPPPSRSNTPRSVSPTKPNIFQQQQEQESQQGSASGDPMQRDSSKTSTSSFPPPPPPFARGKFQHEQWAPHLNNLKFDMPQSPQGRSPSRTSTRKRPRTRPQRASNTQASVGDAEDDPTAGSATGESLESSKASSDVDAMDVDEPTPPSAKTVPQHTNGGYVPSAQPDVSNNTPRQGPMLPPRSPAVPPRTNGLGQPEKRASHLNLGDLKNVYPFAPSNEGLGNMNEMGTTLPQPSHSSPTKQPTESSRQQIKFPNPPLCPSNPLNLTQHSWDHYCLNLRRYLDEWTKFNDQMAEILKSITRESVKCRWLDPEGTGYDKHMNMLDEHQRARVHLEVACENNEKCMKSLGDAMDAKVRGRGGVGRKQSNAGPILEGLL